MSRFLALMGFGSVRTRLRVRLAAGFDSGIPCHHERAAVSDVVALGGVLSPRGKRMAGVDHETQPAHLRGRRAAPRDVQQSGGRGRSPFPGDVCGGHDGVRGRVPCGRRRPDAETNGVDHDAASFREVLVATGRCSGNYSGVAGCRRTGPDCSRAVRGPAAYRCSPQRRFRDGGSPATGGLHTYGSAWSRGHAGRSARPSLGGQLRLHPLLRILSESDGPDAPGAERPGRRSEPAVRDDHR